MTSTRTPEVIILPAHQPHANASRAAWIEHARILSEIVRRADLRDVVRSIDGGLICTRRSWAKEIVDAATELIGVATEANWSEFESALGLPTEVELSSDGACILTHEWCACGGSSATWVRYERWTVPGRIGHGFVCRSCRRLTQTG